MTPMPKWMAVFAVIGYAIYWIVSRWWVWVGALGVVVTYLLWRAKNG